MYSSTDSLSLSLLIAGTVGIASVKIYISAEAQELVRQQLMLTVRHMGR